MPEEEDCTYQGHFSMKPAKKLSLYENRRPGPERGLPADILESPVRNAIAARILRRHFGSPTTPRKCAKVLELRRRRLTFTDQSSHPVTETESARSKQASHYTHATLGEAARRLAVFTPACPSHADDSRLVFSPAPGRKSEA